MWNPNCSPWRHQAPSTDTPCEGFSPNPSVYTPQGLIFPHKYFSATKCLARCENRANESVPYPVWFNSFLSPHHQHVNHHSHGFLLLNRCCQLPILLCFRCVTNVIDIVPFCCDSGISRTAFGHGNCSPSIRCSICDQSGIMSIQSEVLTHLLYLCLSHHGQLNQYGAFHKFAFHDDWMVLHPDPQSLVIEHNGKLAASLTHE